MNENSHFYQANKIVLKMLIHEAVHLARASSALLKQRELVKPLSTWDEKLFNVWWEGRVCDVLPCDPAQYPPSVCPLAEPGATPLQAKMHSLPTRLQTFTVTQQGVNYLTECSFRCSLFLTFAHVCKLNPLFSPLPPLKYFHVLGY